MYFVNQRICSLVKCLCFNKHEICVQILAYPIQGQTSKTEATGAQRSTHSMVVQNQKSTHRLP
jgi:hypothetical protein